jgi:hypothetical protein
MAPHTDVYKTAMYPKFNILSIILAREAVNPQFALCGLLLCRFGGFRAFHNLNLQLVQAVHVTGRQLRSLLD